ncbi:helix-turn-helix transcriptional regulator [Methylocaldum sp. RMAD-M]|jgi:ribosome-binding protein aMBF1 (putative translation factor)|uniref:helix-turn-helix domain-containing protein n=1 Tax=unclassified Methylocaldum TaxID=2622260 RepID=UPI000A32A0D9|nr:helix-turn-helix transcriptional regulator [Methylocaldum sp. RMAD-M]MBP1150094.1 ribosome-binding protein aMBF1 (putative translation factor) [Methylocaldum sp. RMAD-M]
MDVQIIEKEGSKWAMIPYDDYLSLVELAELATDMASDVKTEERLVPGEEQLPDDLKARLLAGENAIRIWREFRGLTLEELAERAGITESFVALVDRGRPTCRIDKLKRIAEVLGVHLENILRTV